MTCSSVYVDQQYTYTDTTRPFQRASLQKGTEQGHSIRNKSDKTVIAAGKGLWGQNVLPGLLSATSLAHKFPFETTTLHSNETLQHHIEKTCSNFLRRTIEVTTTHCIAQAHAAPTYIHDIHTYVRMQASLMQHCLCLLMSSTFQCLCSGTL